MMPLLAVKCKSYTSVGQLGTYRTKLTACKHLALVTGISKKVAQEAIRLYNAREMPIPKVAGQPVRTIELKVVCQICELVLDGNKNGVPVNFWLLS